MTKQELLKVADRAMEKIAAQKRQELGRELSFGECLAIARAVRREMKIK